MIAAAGGRAGLLMTGKAGNRGTGNMYGIFWHTYKTEYPLISEKHDIQFHGS
jgi:hypothetical protein